MSCEAKLSDVPSFTNALHYLIRSLRRGANASFRVHSDGNDSILYERVPFLFLGKTSTVQMPIEGRVYSSIMD